MSGAAWLAVVALGAAGCAHRPYPTGYLDNYAGLVNQRSPCYTVFAQRVLFENPPRANHVLQLLPSRWDAPLKLQPSQEKDLLDFLDDRLLIYLQRMAPKQIIVTTSRDTDTFLAIGADVTRTRVSITHITKGFGIVRPVLGGFGLGATEVQVEGRLEDVNTRKVAAIFARRNRSAGVAYGFMTPQSVRPRFCWRLALDESAELLSRYAIAQLSPPPPNWQKTIFTRAEQKPTTATPRPLPGPPQPTAQPQPQPTPSKEPPRALLPVPPPQPPGPEQLVPPPPNNQQPKKRRAESVEVWGSAPVCFSFKAPCGLV